MAVFACNEWVEIRFNEYSRESIRFLGYTRVRILSFIRFG